MCPLIEGCGEGVGEGGVTAMLFSADGRYLATTVHQHPTVVWIWSMPKLLLSTVLVHSNSVKGERGGDTRREAMS